LPEIKAVKKGLATALFFGKLLPVAGCRLATCRGKSNQTFPLILTIGHSNGAACRPRKP
jgi:hypothetical protein